MSKCQIGITGDGLLIHITNANGDEAYVTIDLPLRVLVVKKDGTTTHGDSIHPGEAFYMLTGHRSADVLEMVRGD